MNDSQVPASVTGDTSGYQTIILVRHGETEWSRSGLHTGMCHAV